MTCLYLQFVNLDDWAEEQKHNKDSQKSRHISWIQEKGKHWIAFFFRWIADPRKTRLWRDEETPSETFYTTYWTKCLDDRIQSTQIIVWKTFTFTNQQEKNHCSRYCVKSSQISYNFHPSRAFPTCGLGDGGGGEVFGDWLFHLKIILHLSTANSQSIQPTTQFMGNALSYGWHFQVPTKIDESSLEETHEKAS